MIYFPKIASERVKQFGSRSGLAFCQAFSGSKLFAKVISQEIDNKVVPQQYSGEVMA